MPSPFFSIIIPTLNEEQYLPKLLQSLVRQLDKDFEVILVDAQSEDKTLPTARKFMAPLRHIHILTSRRRNPAYQRNLGAKTAHGKYLVFLDADTSIPSNFLSQIHHYLLDQNPQCELLTTWIKPDTTQESGKILATLYNIIMETTKSINRPMLGGSNIILKKSAFLRVGMFNHRVQLAEDHDLAKRLVATGARYTILKSPQIIISFRRFRSQGTLKVLKKYTEITAKYFLHGPIKLDADYPMGGHHFPPARTSSQ
ncbi:MAG: glycosyltransferase [Candidatus Chisholmbacteria bacterium]|nr:glycosyltransferase [Candidatus Chisholmbacteria bacterium]